jgi:hypothetical protein
MILLERTRDYMMNGWQLIDSDGVGYQVRLDLTDTSIFASNNLAIPIQFRGANELYIEEASLININNIKGMPIGHQFKITNLGSANVIFNPTAKASAVA